MKIFAAASEFMRLGQLARKIGVPPADIVAYLKQHRPDLEMGTNSKLDEQLLVTLTRQFAPNLEAEVIQESVVNEVSPPMPVVETPTAEIEISLPAEPTTEQTDAVEVIRAPKVELQGLKVIGKIDLPEPKQKETPPPPEQKEDEPVQPVRRSRPQKPPARTWQNPMETQRRREAQEREARRQADLEREKAKRTENYLKKVKSVPTKAVKRYEEPLMEMPQDQETKPPPRTWLGKIARWLTT